MDMPLNYSSRHIAQQVGLDSIDFNGFAFERLASAVGPFRRAARQVQRANLFRVYGHTFEMDLRVWSVLSQSSLHLPGEYRCRTDRNRRSSKCARACTGP